MPTVTLRSSGQAGFDQWDLLNGTIKWENVNNTPADDTRGIRAEGPGIIQALHQDDVPSDTVKITSATFRARVKCVADIGVVCRLRLNLIVAGDPTPVKGTVFKDFSDGQGPAEFTIGTISGLSLIKAQGDSFIAQCAANNGSGWVVGNGTLDVLELYLDITYVIGEKELHVEADTSAPVTPASALSPLVEAEVDEVSVRADVPGVLLEADE